MNTTGKFFFGAAIVSIISCKNKNDNNFGDGLNAFSADSLGKNISILSSDSFQGRKPFTPGETITVNWLRDQFAAMGIEPGNNGSYFQNVPMVNITAIAEPTMQVASPRRNFSLKGFDDYVISTDKTDSVITLDKTEMIFAGYGVVAPEYNWNDYAGIDVRGKLVLVLVNDPGFGTGDSTLFKGRAMTYYGRWTYKFEEAARQGAKGCLIIHTTHGASYPFSVLQNGWNTASLRLDNKGKNEQLCDVVGWVTSETGKKILDAAGFDSTLIQSADQRGFRAVALPVKLTTKMKVKAEFNNTKNVVAKITGSTFPDETIIYTAHWDHLGIDKPDEKGDSIYNGALDNASGTAGLLEFARAFKSLRPKPERTIIFLAVTAEEQGLCGSEWYAQNPLYPVKKTLANINIDGLNWFGKTKDITVIGEGQSELEDYLREEAAKFDRVIAYDLHPEAGHYYRSDHFNFAKVGIPAIYAGQGRDLIGKGIPAGKQYGDEYNNKNYHRPSDEYDPKVWKLDGAIEDLKLLFLLGRRIGSGNNIPQWKPGSEFRAIGEQR